MRAIEIHVSCTYGAVRVLVPVDRVDYVREASQGHALLKIGDETIESIQSYEHVVNGMFDVMQDES